MSNHWLLAMGINQYRHLQPLNYAQADAQGLWNFLVGKAGFMPDRCLLLTDSSPFVQGESTYPSRENMRKWIDWLCQQGKGAPLQAGDVVWCFFSGYGVNFEGEDYLMPIDGNPANIGGTSIPVRSLLESLKVNSSVMTLALLDLKHPPVTGAGAGVGVRTLELARELEVPTIVSHAAPQASLEVADLHHGLFAKALIDVLKAKSGNTLENLTAALRDRLPVLCEQNSLPRQDPAFAVHPPEKMHRVLLPYNAVAATAKTVTSNEQADGAVATTMSGTIATMPQNSNNVSNSSGKPPNPFEQALNKAEPAFAGEPEAEDGMRKTTSVAPKNNATGGNSGSFWQQLLLWTGGVLLGLLVLVSIFGRRDFGSRTATTPNSPEGTVPTLSAPGSPEQANQARLKKATSLLQQNQVSQFNEAINLASQIKPGEPLYNEAQEAIARWSKVILDTAQGRAEQGKFEEAIAAAGLVPKKQASYEEAQKLIAGWRASAKQQQTNRNLLTAAKGLIKPGQASTYNKGIDLLRQIPAGQPGSSEAKKLTEQWSQTILTLAQTRASQGSIDAAIKTASLIPANTPAYPKAKEAIALWQKQLKQKK